MISTENGRTSASPREMKRIVTSTRIVTSILEKKIAIYVKKHGPAFKPVLEKLINNMLDKCRYINGESLERHNWGEMPTKLNFISENFNLPLSKDAEEELLNVLDLEEREKSIIELLWGDVQLGKRIQACVIMWVSVHILERPVLYIFRNLKIDQKQLQNDIVGTENYNFNVQFIKNLFVEFNDELRKEFNESSADYWKKFKLPELKDINSNDLINKLGKKDALNPTDIYCCLMNDTQLEKLNVVFNEYVIGSKELVNISLLVDESDLMAPTASNDRSNKNDKKDTALCEILLAKLYKKVKYVLHITGTAHSLLYNVTTRLSDDTDIQTKISKVHKMVRSDDYYGLFNNKIHFNIEEEKGYEELTLEEKYYSDNYGSTFKKPIINSWWDNGKYEIVEDYNRNIKKIIEIIRDRKTQKYNSLLISEEKKRVNQFNLVYKILQDFPDLFIIIYHGNCLRLYLSKDYEQEIKNWSQWEKRLWQTGGVYGSAIDSEKCEKLPNNYCYYEIDTKILNIKMIYKLLRILFEKSVIDVKNKTVITITGKFGERGYSFTSDDYDTFSFHLTDQYFVSHASFNCTNISQSFRVQCKSNDVELKNGTMKLILWTTPLLHDVIQKFYVNFIKKIETNIMNCETWEEIKNVVEEDIDTEYLLNFKYMKYIDVPKKRKNLVCKKLYDSKNKGYKLIELRDMTELEIADFCEEKKLPCYICVNEIKETSISNLKNEDKNWYTELTEINYEEVDDESLKIQKYTLTLNTGELYLKKIRGCINEKYIGSYKSLALQNKRVSKDEHVLITDEINRKKYRGTFKPLQYNLNITKNIRENMLELKKRRILYKDNNDVIWKSTIKPEYKPVNKQNESHGYVNENGDDFIEDGEVSLDTYYWKTPDGWLYLYDKNKNKCEDYYSLSIVTPLPVVNGLKINIEPNVKTNIGPSVKTNVKQNVKTNNGPLVNTIVNVTATIIKRDSDVFFFEPVINNSILLFTQSCFKPSPKSNLRIGINDIHEIYEKWCKLNNKTCVKHKRLKEELGKLKYIIEKSKGVDMNDNSGKRGYNVMVSL